MLPSSLVARTRHPAWARFAESLSGDEEVLLIHAPMGVGRLWFARSWWGAGDQVDSHPWAESDAERVVRVRGAAPVRATAGVTVVDSLVQALALWRDDADGERAADRNVPDGAYAAGTAILLDAPLLDWGVLADWRWRMVTTEDLLLTVDEIAELAVDPRLPRPVPADRGRRTAEQIWRITGGWLEPTAVLLADPKAMHRAEPLMMADLASWIAELDSPALAQVGYLDPITDDNVGAFFDELVEEAPSLDALVRAGIVVRDGEQVVMPSMVRDCLRQLVKQRDPELAARLETLSIETVARTAGLLSAATNAVGRRSWEGLGSVMIERWAELFTSDARTIQSVVSAMPTAFLQRWLGESFGAAMRLVDGASADGMSFVLPDGSVTYQQDTVAQALRTRSERLARNPGVRALTFGVMEVGYLRLSGHDAQATAAAHRLLEVARRTESRAPLRPVMGSIVFLHAGVALATGGAYGTAQKAFLEAYRRVEHTSHGFVLADTTSKLAVYAAIKGDTAEARRWLVEHDKWIGGVGWGRSMVSRSATLARVMLALVDLDLTAADEALAQLPERPDQDETWQIHAYLMALRDMFAGQPAQALEGIQRLRSERPHPSSTPLADRLFTIAEHFTALVGGPAAPRSAAADIPEARLVDAYATFATGDLDRAAQELAKVPVDQLGDRWVAIAHQLHVLMGRADAEPLTAVLVDGVVSRQGALTDLALLWRHGKLPAEALDRLRPDRRARLTARPQGSTTVSRPVLTPRELEVLAGLRQGLTRREIAEKQLRSENTVRSQVRSLYAKLGASSFEEAMAAARRFGL